MNNPLFVAKVSDNKDTDGLNRIKITYTNEEEVVSNWIPYLTPLAGQSTGFSALPEVDDQVVVLNLPNGMIAMGAIWSEKATPPETGENSDADLNQDGKNALRFIKTKAENMLIFDDTDGKEKIQIIENKNNSRIEFLSEDKKIVMTTDEGIDLTAKKDITINAENMTFEADKQINISCEDFQVKASKEINIEASKDMTLKGSGISLN